MARQPIFQIGIIGFVGVAATVLAFTANIIRNGWLTATASAAIILVILILTVQQIRCVIFGRCYFTSWFNTLISVSILGSAAIYYLFALLGRVPLPGIEDQPITSANQNIKYVTDTLKNQLNFDVYGYVSGSSMNLSA